MAGLRDADAGARQVGFEDGRRGVSRSVGHRPGIQHQGSAATRKSRAVAAPRSARFPREQLSVQVVDEFGVFQGRGKHLPFQAMLRTQTGDCLLACGGVWVAKRGLLVEWVGFIGVGLDTVWR